MHPNDLARFIKDLALDAGFERCGIAPARPIDRADYLRTWLDAGRSGSMAYLHRYFNCRSDPRNLLEGAKSVIVVALVYGQDAPDAPPAGDAAEPQGRVAQYAWGEDYHRIVKEKLATVVDGMRRGIGTPFEARVCVDTAPALERELAASAGIGWIGKNTLVLDAALGSYFFLGLIVTTLELRPDEPVLDRCGTCTACLTACPTNAFPAPYEMDASRCISYLTIEHRAEIPEAFHRAMGDWVFGCDVCQEVCPYNRKAPPTREDRLTAAPGASPRSPTAGLPLRRVLEWSPEDYARALRGSAMKRAKLDMLKRNARIVLRNVEG